MNAQDSTDEQLLVNYNVLKTRTASKLTLK